MSPGKAKPIHQQSFLGERWHSHSPSSNKRRGVGEGGGWGFLAAFELPSSPLLKILQIYNFRLTNPIKWHMCSRGLHFQGAVEAQSREKLWSSVDQCWALSPWRWPHSRLHLFLQNGQSIDQLELYVTVVLHFLSKWPYSCQECITWTVHSLCSHLPRLIAQPPPAPYGSAFHTVSPEGNRHRELP